MHQLAVALPGLEHLSFFADGSDDITLSLFFGAQNVRQYIAPRLKSFGWRARSETPQEARTFAATSMFISFAEFLKDCNQLGCIVLDCNAEAMAMSAQDLELVLSSLQRRQLEIQGNSTQNHSPQQGYPALTLMLCGLMSRWRPGDADLDVAESHPAYIKARPRSPCSVPWDVGVDAQPNPGIHAEANRSEMTQYGETDTQWVTVLSQGCVNSRTRVLSTSQPYKVKLAVVPYSDRVQFDPTWEARLTLHRKAGITNHQSTQRGFLGSMADKMGHVREIFLDRPSIEDDKDVTLAEQLVRLGYLFMAR